ncbi:MAG TPA: hypothetical protein PKW35_13200 [Nannocystaceae bacterium]|nr:hypothetical protein [Nannocystaceae bacterium]
MSPLTTSFFTSWAFFDAAANEETIGTVILALANVLGMHPDMQHLIEQMQRSRMGIYSCQGEDGEFVGLREFVTGVVFRAITPATTRGRKGEIWYARLLPSPLPDRNEHVVFTTPYVLQEPGSSEWQAYFRRVLPAGPMQARLDAYARHMKYGPTPTYWPEFVFEGYAGQTSGAVQLIGLPDLAASRPHSAVNTSGRGRG